MPEFRQLFSSEPGMVFQAAAELMNHIAPSDDLRLSRHPLGFYYSVHVFVGSVVRLHVWPHGYTSSASYAVHNHNFSFESVVLLGAIENVTYRVARRRDAGSRLYDVIYDGKMSRLVPTDTTVTVEEASRQVTRRFGAYSIAAGVFHQSVVVADEVACTIVVASPSSQRRPLVVGPVDAAPVPFERSQVPEQESRELVSLVRARFRGTEL